MRQHCLAGGVLVCCLCLCCTFTSAAAPANTITDVVEFIKKGHEEISEALANGLDVNTPDSKGRLAIVEAVRAKSEDAVDTLIMYGAMLKVKEATSGSSPLHVAFANDLVSIARLLLAYGADPNVTDKAGKKARDFVKSASLKELLAAYDKHGAMAFEDEPGTWIKGGTPGKSEFWFNTKTSSSRWNMPPSCAWRRTQLPQQPFTYANAITGQSTHAVPRALAWRRVSINDSLIWYNWKVNMSQHSQPAELPSELASELAQEVNHRWYNTVTGEQTWEDPLLHTPWRKVEPGEGPADADQAYFYNLETGERTWEMPDELAWEQVEDEEHPGTYYYFHHKTGESQWDIPASHAWTKVTDEL